MLQSNKSALQPLIDRLTLHSMLSEAEQGALCRLTASPRKVAVNHDIARVGERTEYACMVVSGLVGRVEQTSSGERQISALYIPGDMPDSLSVVQPTATSALQALSPVEIVRVPHKELRALVGTYHGITEAFWRQAAADALVFSQWVANVGRRPAKTRIAHLICEMAWRYQVAPTSGGLAFNLPMTQTHLADATGLTPVHVNRSLKALRDDGVEFRRGAVLIDDWTALVATADFDPVYLQVDYNARQRVRIADAA